MVGTTVSHYRILKIPRSLGSGGMGVEYNTMGSASRRVVLRCRPARRTPTYTSYHCEWNAPPQK